MADSCIIGIDWGGTRIKLGAVGPEGELLLRQVFDSPKEADIDGVFADLMEQVARFVSANGLEPEGIGIALTGPVDPELGVVLLPGKVKGLEGYPVVPKLKERFGLPVFATNDGLAAMIAEKYCGHAKGRRFAVSITLGTGVGSGVMIDGRIPDDPHFMFGTQLGHVVLDVSDDRLCLTSARGTGEMNCSATALAMSVRSGLQRGIPSTLSERYWENPHAVDFQAVIEDGVEKGDELCMDELGRWTRRVGWLLVNAVHAYSPEVIILSGGATLASDHFLPALRDHVAKHIFRYPPGEEVPIRVSEISDHAGVIGAAMNVKERQ
ncbi:MAG: ROK family protein [Verrucomicrobiota bacterium]